MRRVDHKSLRATLVLALVCSGWSGGANPVRGQELGAPYDANATETSAPQPEETKAGKALSVGTFNTMMWPWMPFEAPIIARIANTDFDVLVLQEVWTKAAQDRIVAAVGKKYRYHYAGSDRPNEPTIGAEFSEPSQQLLALANSYINCVITAGIDTQTLIQPYPNPAPFECSIYSIQLSLFGLDPISQQAFACLLNGMQKQPSDGVSPFKVIPTCGAREGPRFAMDGVNGQLILSKYPISQVSETHFDSWLVNRVNIFATIRNTRFAFAHFGHDVIAEAGFPIPTYGAIQIDHVNDILAKAPDVIVGDFHSGPDYQPTGYNALISAGYKDLVPQPFSTWCPSTHLGFQPCVNSGSVSGSLDHILVKANASGAFTGAFATDLLSDHMGVSAIVGGRPDR